MSYTLNTTVIPDSNNQSNFQAWALVLHNALISSGWVQTSDTGQTAPASLPALGGADQSGGYEVFKLADTLQATKPYFLKLEYGGGAHSPGVIAPAVYLTIGTSTNGAGTMTGNVSQRFQLSANGNSGSAYSCYFCGDVNRFAAMLWSDPSFDSGHDEIFFSIERTKNASGADTGDGLILFGGSAGDINWTNHADSPTAMVMTVIPSDSTPAVYFSPWPAPVSSLGSLQNSTDNTVGAIFPVPFGYQPYNPGLGVLLYQGTDFSPYAPAVMPGVYAASHTYMPMSQATQAAGRAYSGAGVSNAHIMMRWE